MSNCVLDRNKEVYVLYGSQTGNGESIAMDLFARCQELGVPSRCQPLNSVRKVDLRDSVSLMVVVVSTTGNGDSPENADGFWRALKLRSNAKDMYQGVNFAVLGLGDTNYDKFCCMGKCVDKRLGELCGRRIVPLVCADEVEGLEGFVTTFRDAIIPIISASYCSNGGAEVNGTDTPDGSAAPATAASAEHKDASVSPASAPAVPPPAPVPEPALAAAPPTSAAAIMARIMGGAGVGMGNTPSKTAQSPGAAGTGTATTPSAATATVATTKATDSTAASTTTSTNDAAAGAATAVEASASGPTSLPAALARSISGGRPPVAPGSIPLTAAMSAPAATTAALPAGLMSVQRVAEALGVYEQEGGLLFDAPPNGKLLPLSSSSKKGATAASDTRFCVLAAGSLSSAGGASVDTTGAEAGSGAMTPSSLCISSISGSMGGTPPPQLPPSPSHANLSRTASAPPSALLSRAGSSGGSCTNLYGLSGGIGNALSGSRSFSNLRDLGPGGLVSASPTWTASHPFSASVVHARWLTTNTIDASSACAVTDPDEQRRVVHMEVSLGSSGIDFSPGDSIGICPPNPPELVAMVLQQANRRVGYGGCAPWKDSQDDLAELLTLDTWVQVCEPQAPDGLDGIPVGGSMGGVQPQSSGDINDNLSRTTSMSSIGSAAVPASVTAGPSGSCYTRSTVTLGEVLTYRLDLSGPISKKAAVMALATECRDPRERNAMLWLCSKGAEGKALWKHFVEQQGLTVPELLALFPSCCPPISLLLSSSVLPPLPPRYYSIASSPLSNGFVVSVAFSVVSFRCGVDIRGGSTGTKAAAAGGQTGLTSVVRRRGLCTSYLERVVLPKFLHPESEAGTGPPPPPLRIFHKPNPTFHLPSSISTPMLLVGPGTGVAPFVGFLEHRSAQERERRCLGGDMVCGVWRGGYEFDEDELPSECNGAGLGKFVQGLSSGPTWLFFGCRNQNDFLYGPELQRRVDEGVLTVLDVAMSRVRADGSKVYVTHRLRENGAEVADLLLRQGASVYVCGDGTRMSKDVEKALKDILLEHSAATAAAYAAAVPAPSAGGQQEQSQAQACLGSEEDVCVGSLCVNRIGSREVSAPAAPPPVFLTEKEVDAYIRDLKTRRRYCQDIWG